MCQLSRHCLCVTREKDLPSGNGVYNPVVNKPTLVLEYRRLEAVVCQGDSRLGRSLLELRQPDLSSLEPERVKAILDNAPICTLPRRRLLRRGDRRLFLQGAPGLCCRGLRRPGTHSAAGQSTAVLDAAWSRRMALRGTRNGHTTC